MKHAAQVENSDRCYRHVRIGVNSRLDARQTAVLLPKPEILDEAQALRDQTAASCTAALHALGITDTPCVADGNVSAWARNTILAEQVMSVVMPPYLDQDATQRIVQAVAQGIERNAQR